MLIKPNIDETEFRWVLAKQVYPNCVKDIEADRCPTCGGEIREEDYDTETAKAEYTRCGMCQGCLYEVFGDDDDDDDYGDDDDDNN